ncbi:MAG: hypothetical protein NT093_03200 [Candidatus Moranbacteria bacterium]|nr:hypothetical protein [Candidatus Moranbacteria bacterium]
MNKRLIISISSIIIAILAVWYLMQVGWSAAEINIAYAFLAIFFLAMLVSSQQYEEDIFSKVERTVSALLLSYIVFFYFSYAPLSQFFFGTLVTETSFVADMLSLILFMIFFVLFGTVFLVVSRFARVGLFPNWRFLNNKIVFFISRILFIPAVGIFVLFFRWK